MRHNLKILCLWKTSEAGKRPPTLPSLSVPYPLGPVPCRCLPCPPLLTSQPRVAHPLRFLQKGGDSREQGPWDSDSFSEDCAVARGSRQSGAEAYLAKSVLIRANLRLRRFLLR